MLRWLVVISGFLIWLQAAGVAQGQTPEPFEQHSGASAITQGQGTVGGREPGYLGLKFLDDPGRAPGNIESSIVVFEVIPGGPADLAGVRAGDWILSIDAAPVRTAGQLLQQLERRFARDAVELQVWRGDATAGALQTLPPITLGVRPPNLRQFDAAASTPPSLVRRPPLLGVTVAAVPAYLQERWNLPHRRGAYITGLTVGSPADTAGLPSGAVVWAVDGVDVNTPNEFGSAIQAAGPGAQVMLSYWHNDDQPQRATITLATPRGAEDWQSKPEVEGASPQQDANATTGVDAAELQRLRAENQQMRETLKKWDEYANSMEAERDNLLEQIEALRRQLQQLQSGGAPGAATDPYGDPVAPAPAGGGQGLAGAENLLEGYP